MISTAEFDARFDAGEDMTAYLDLSSAHRPGQVAQQTTLRTGIPVAVWRLLLGVEQPLLRYQRAMAARTDPDPDLKPARKPRKKRHVA